MDVKRSDILMAPNNRRVLFRPFEFGDTQRVMKIIARVMELSEAEVDSLLEQVLADFKGRHQRLTVFFLQRFYSVQHHLLTDRSISENRKQLIGSYFTQEYALESAALFNPSMIWHPDQSGLPSGAKRFIVSLRATGEGHISSICFRSGVVDSAGQITLDKASRYVTSPEVVPNSQYEKVLFQRKLYELGITHSFVDIVLSALDDTFTMQQLEESVRFSLRQNRARLTEWDPLGRMVLSLARANYVIQYEPSINVSERIVFPYSPTETNGIEDARFVHVKDIVAQNGVACARTIAVGELSAGRRKAEGTVLDAQHRKASGISVQDVGVAGKLQDAGAGLRKVASSYVSGDCREAGT